MSHRTPSALSLVAVLALGHAQTSSAATPARFGASQPFFVPGTFTGVAFANNDTLVALAEDRLRCWDVQTTQLRWDVPVAPGANPATISALGDTIAFIGDGIELRDTTDGHFRANLPSARRLISGAALVNVNELVVSEATGQVALIDLSRRTEHTLRGAELGFGCFAAASDSWASCRGSEVFVWNTRGESQPTLDAEARVLGLAVSRTRIAVRTPGALRVFSRRNDQKETELDIGIDGQQMALSEDGSRLAVTRTDGVDVYTLPTGIRLHQDRPSAGVSAIGFGSDGQRITVVDLDGKRRAWRVADANEVPSVEGDLPRKPQCPGRSGWDMSSDCRAGALGVGANQVRIWRAGKRELVVKLEHRRVFRAAFTENLALLTSIGAPVPRAFPGRRAAPCKLYAVDTRGIRWQLDVGAECTTAPAVMRNGQLVAVGTDRSVLFVNGTTGDARYVAVPAPTRAIAFSPDGSNVAAGLADGTVALVASR